jgi:hypothetical protein
MFYNTELEQQRKQITQKIAALRFDEDAYNIARYLGRQEGFHSTFMGEHAGRSWRISYGGEIGVLVEVDGETVLHQNISHYNFEVYTYREWPERDWLPAFSSLGRLALERKRLRDIAAKQAEQKRFIQHFGPIRSISLAEAA